MTSINVSQLSDFNEIKSLCKQWNSLITHESISVPFFHPEWIMGWIENWNVQERLCFLIFEKDCQFIGLLPMYFDCNMGVRKLRYCSDTMYPDPLGIIASKIDQNDCLQAALQFLSRQHYWDVLTLPWLEQEHAESAKESGLDVTIEFSTKQPYIPLPSSLEDYLAGFKKKKRYNLKRMVKQFYSSGGEFHSASSDEEKVKLIKKMFAIHGKRAIERGIESTFSGEKTMQFHLQMVKQLEYAKIHYLTLQDEIIAVLYGFDFNGVFYYYQVAHLPRYSEFGPGKILVYETLGECIGTRLKEFNFLQGDEDYKSFWTKHSRNLYNVSLYNRTVRARYYRMLQITRQIAKSLLRKGK